MKNTIKIISLLLVAMLVATGLCACVDPGYDIDIYEDEVIDQNRTQLYVYNFNGGFGTEWLVAAKQRYEELHKDDVYEEGKKGVQIYINPQKTNAAYLSATSVLSNRDELYFTEYGYYYSLKAQGILGDITSAFTTPNKYDNNKILLDKLTQQQKDFYGIDENGTDHYYAIPHYCGYSGIVYNIDLFDEKGYYFIDEPTGTKLEDFFIYDDADKKSPGPDGIYETDDDGLPRTYAEFFTLCEYIYKDGNTPLCWTGSNYKDYITYFMQELVADYEGLDQMLLNYSLDGVANSLGKIVNGEFVLDDNSTTITSANGYELSRQASKYYALQFVQKIVSTDNFHNQLAFNTGFTHLDAQDEFLWAGLDGKTAPVAMLIEGIWWENESSGTAKTIATSKGQQYSRMNRRFGFMPMPKATEEKYQQDVANGNKNTLVDYIYSICFMKSNIADWKKPLAIDFIQFCYSDESLVEFTQITNTPKALNYTMTDEQMAKMSEFGRSVMKLKQKSDIVYPIAQTSKFINNQEFFGPLNSWQATLSIGSKTYPANAFHETTQTVADYFNGMYKYYSESWSSLK